MELFVFLISVPKGLHAPENAPNSEGDDLPLSGLVWGVNLYLIYKEKIQ
jgi:hypothetical protein